jgi:hypothetical protein
MASKLGFHIIEPYRFRGYDQAVVNARPRVIKVLGGPSELGILSYYHDKIGNGTTYIARVWPFEKTIADMLATGQGPIQAADTMYNLLHNFVHAASMEWLWFECGPNEPSDDEKTLDWLDSYYADLIPMLAADGIRSVSLNFSVCHIDPLSAWQNLSWALAAIRKAGPLWAIVGLHEYGLYGDIDAYSSTRVLRHRTIPELQTIPIVLTESGLDSPGWQQTNRGTDGYLADLQWLDWELRKDGNVIGACLYTMDTAPGWEPFRIEGDLAVRLFKYIEEQNAAVVEVPPPEPEPIPIPDPAGIVAVKTLCAEGQYIRDHPSYKGRPVGELAPGEMAFISLDQRVSIGQDYTGKDKSWVYAKKAGCEGWMAVWLLKQVA